MIHINPYCKIIVLFDQDMQPQLYPQVGILVNRCKDLISNA